MKIDPNVKLVVEVLFAIGALIALGFYIILSNI